MFFFRLQTIFMKFDEVKNSGNMISSNVSGEYVEAFEEY